MAKKHLNVRFTLSILLSVVLFIVCIIASITLFTRSFNYTQQLVENDTAREKNPNIREIQIVVSPGTSVKEIAQILYENDLISHPLTFRLASRWNKLDTKLRPGEYSISSNMSSDQILKLLTSDITNANETIKFTIPEGYTIIQIANTLDQLDIVSKESFLEAVYTRAYDYEFLKELPQDMKYPLEGYLFPDTYIVRKGATPEEIIIKMLNRFEEIIHPYNNAIKTSPYSLHEIVTMASIIEQEAKLSEERPIIAGVIYNRLEANMKLQMCSTIQYILEKRKTSLSYEDLKVDSPYNTYTNNGIPIGPICAPGAESLIATVMPDTHNYYFFVVKNIQEGSHAFSSNAKDHELNKRRYQQSIDKNFYE